MIKKAEEALEADEISSYENKNFIKKQIERIYEIAKKLNVIQVNLDFSEKVLAANGKNTDEVKILKKLPDGEFLSAVKAMSSALILCAPTWFAI